MPWTGGVKLGKHRRILFPQPTWIVLKRLVADRFTFHRSHHHLALICVQPNVREREKRAGAKAKFLDAVSQFQHEFRKLGECTAHDLQQKPAKTLSSHERDSRQSSLRFSRGSRIKQFIDPLQDLLLLSRLRLRKSNERLELVWGCRWIFFNKVLSAKFENCFARPLHIFDRFRSQRSQVFEARPFVTECPMIEYPDFELENGTHRLNLIERIMDKTSASSSWEPDPHQHIELAKNRINAEIADAKLFQTYSGCLLKRAAVVGFHAQEKIIEFLSEAPMHRFVPQQNLLLVRVSFAHAEVVSGAGCRLAN